MSPKDLVSAGGAGDRPMKPSRLNIVYKITTANGWRTEWDMEFRDGVPRWVTLTKYSPENVPTMHPAPVRISAERFFEEFEKEWGRPGERPA